MLTRRTASAIASTSERLLAYPRAGPSCSRLATALPQSRRISSLQRPRRTAAASCLASPSRPLSSSAPRQLATPVDDAEMEEKFDLATVERVSDDVDVCIVGGGPSGLCAAIRLRQLALEAGKDDFRVVVVEKGGEVGAHILSGAVIETRALDELLPDWKERGAPLNQPATSDSMRFLTAKSSFPMPHPPQMNNKGNYIVSLSKVCRWLAEQAEEIGVEIYAGFAGARVLYTEDGKGVRGIVTNEIGLDRNYQPKDSFEPGMEFHANVTLFAEGCHGSLTKKLISHFDLRKGKDPQTYGLGIKEVWRVRDEVYQPGKIVHTMGWPLSRDTYGGSWLYHLEDNMVSLGLVVGLDYPNPYTSPFREFQRMKHHPFFAEILKDGECLAYGARALNEGGYQSIPKLTFPGGALIGCTAGFLNVPKIKGTHTAMKSGMLAAEATWDALKERTPAAEEEPEQADGEKSTDVSAYEKAIDESWVMKELKEVRNLRPSFHNPLGFWGGVAYSGLDSLILKGRVPWTFHHKTEDYAATKPARYVAKLSMISFQTAQKLAPTGNISRLNTRPRTASSLSTFSLRSLAPAPITRKISPSTWSSRMATTRATPRPMWASSRGC